MKAIRLVHSSPYFGIGHNLTHLQCRPGTWPRRQEPRPGQGSRRHGHKWGSEELSTLGGLGGFWRVTTGARTRGWRRGPRRDEVTRTDPRRDNTLVRTVVRADSNPPQPSWRLGASVTASAWPTAERNDWTGADESLFALLIVSLQRCCACVTYSAGVFPSLPSRAVAAFQAFLF